MAVTADKIKMGVCDVSFGGTDLGSTKGGVEVEIKTETYKIKADQTGENTLKEIILGTEVIVKVPMLETDLTKLKEILPQGTLGGTGATQFLTIAPGTNLDLLVSSKKLVLHPTGAGADVSGDFTIYKAGPAPSFSFKYDTGSERVYEVTFTAYPDTANANRLAAFGAAPV